MRSCLILEGGGMRALYTAGVLDFLMQENINVDAIIAVSAGSLFGINYVSKQGGRTLRCNLNNIGNKNYLSLYSLLTTGNIMNEKFCFHDLMYDIDPFDFEIFNKSKIKFYSTVTNIETGMPEYIEVKDLREDMEYIRASGSLPLVSKIVKIKDKKYLDGAISDSIPIKKAEQMNFDKIIVVTTHSKGFVKKPYKMLLYKIIYRKYPRFIEALSKRYIVYNETLKYLENKEKDKEIFLIRPSRETNIARLEKNKEKIQEQYDLGYNDANNVIKELKEYLN